MSASDMSPDQAVAPQDSVIQGVYGTYTITASDRREVLAYRLSLLGLAVSLGGLLASWGLNGWTGPTWPWTVGMALCLGLALRWIHIYLLPLHRTLQAFWLLGCFGLIALLLHSKPAGTAQTLVGQPLWILAVGPFFAALAGIGFKEFFCFKRPEAIGLTLVLPTALMGHLLGLLPANLCYWMMLLATALLFVLALRKLPNDEAADIGDKSVFTHLAEQRVFGG